MVCLLFVSVLHEYYGYLYEYLSKVLEYSSTKPKLRLYGKNLGGAQGACTLYKHRYMQPEPKSLNIGVLSLDLLN